MASGLVLGCCETYPPCTLIVYAHDRPIIRYFKNDKGGRRLSVLPPHASQRSRVSAPAFDRDFQCFTGFLIDALCVVHSSLDLVVAFDGDFLIAQDKGPVFECMLEELGHCQDLGRMGNVRSLTAIFSNTPSSHTLLRK
jgi:hypothetical protein